MLAIVSYLYFISNIDFDDDEDVFNMDDDLGDERNEDTPKCK
ncbi:hypothetical protein HanIR_Chr15g0755001 [Helianthus annuus]|nr:hypothetical protein HanIR_Chr15g0755001 [Helianthus annuus]